MGRGLQRPATETGQAVDVPALVSFFFLPLPQDYLRPTLPIGGPIVNFHLRVIGSLVKAMVLHVKKTGTHVLML